MPSSTYLKALAYYYRTRHVDYLPRVELEKRQWQAMRCMLRHAFIHVPFYRRKLEEAGVRPEEILEPSDWARVPITATEELRSHFPGETLADIYSLENCKRMRTSGSTGQPFQFVIDREALSLRLAINLRTCEMSGYRLGKKIVQIAPPIQASGKGFGRWVNRLINRYEVEVFTPEYKRTAQLFYRFAPEFVVGYTSYVKVLTDYFEIHSLSLPQPLIAVMTNSETLLPQYRKRIEKVFQTEVFDQYGSVEFGRIATECECHDGYHINTDAVYLEVLDPFTKQPVPDGEMGALIVTGLLNRAMPFIRYQIGDLAALSPREYICACGRSTPKIVAIHGRLQDTLLTSDGMPVIPDFLYRLLRRFDAIHNFQVVQTSLTAVTLRCVLGRQLNQNERRQIESGLQDYLGSVHITWERLQSIPREQGKFKHIVSTIKNR